VGAAELVDGVHRLSDKGVDGKVEISWTDLIRFKRTFTDPVPESREKTFSEAGITTFHGHARFVGPTVLEIGDERIDAGHVLVASGARPIPLSFANADLMTDSEQFMELGRLPNTIVFVGGGYISFELAHIARSAGARVTILERDRPLEQFDPDLVDMLVGRTRDMGIEVRLGARVLKIEPRTNGLTVHIACSNERMTFDAELVVHGAGRVADIDDLGLQEGEVAHDQHGVIVNEYMQSVSNPNVYAAGDAAKSGPPLTPVASLQARVVAENLVSGNRRRLRYPPVPSVVFTLPPLASVGLREDQAWQQGKRFTTTHGTTSSWYSSRRVGQRWSGYKLLFESGTGRIIGAHVFGPSADDLINVFAMAIEHRYTAQDFQNVLFAYPTVASDIEYMM
jgi:glutathione reductase (NADPH)